MKKMTHTWGFVKRSSRPPLGTSEAKQIKEGLAKNLKVGIELEFNLPKQSRNSCKGNNPKCGCVSPFQTESGEACFERCTEMGSCDIEKEFGCAGIECISFKSPCSSCNHFNAGCSVCPLLNTLSTAPEDRRARIKEALQPTLFLGNLGKNGVLDVVKDGSLLNKGVEVVTVGRKASFLPIKNMCSTIIDEVAKEEAFVDERCSIHYHLLVGYLETGNGYNKRRTNYGLKKNIRGKISDMEAPIPEIVLANFHQLWRKYENALIWITSSGSSRNSLTRWVKFRQPMARYSAVRTSMQKIREQISNEERQGGRYMMVNYNPMQFTLDGKIDKLHFEIRCADGNKSPTAVAAFSSLYYALLLKATDLSVHGILERGDRDIANQNKHVRTLLLNNNGDYNGSRTSDTKGLDPYIGFLVEQAQELVRLVRGGLTKQPHAYRVLQSLAKTPCSLRRISKQSWETIEKDLSESSKAVPNKQPLNLVEQTKLFNIIDTVGILECDSPTEWIKALIEEVQEGSENTKASEENFLTYVNQLLSNGTVFWDKSLGAIIRS